MKKILVIAIFSICFITNAQTKNNQNVIANFEVYDARYNGDDITPDLIENKASLVIYKDYDTLMLSNFWEKANSQSYGEIYSIEKEFFAETETKYKAITYNFQWSYINTYDDKKGTAKIKLILIYKPQGVYYELTMQPEDLNKTVYKGMVKGDVASLETQI